VTVRLGSSRAAYACAAGVLASLVGCSSVVDTRLRDDYGAVDRQRTLRLAVIAAPLPAGLQDLGDVWSMMARKYVNQHRDFIVVQDRAEAVVPADACGERIEGVLLLACRAERRGERVDTAVTARLVRCSDRAEVWQTRAAGTWSTTDDDLVEARRYWVSQSAPVVEPYVVATYRLLTDVLATLPHPTMPDESYVREKIDLGE
jgi:probable lipoprotein (TIGR04455 family)